RVGSATAGAVEDGGQANAAVLHATLQGAGGPGRPHRGADSGRTLPPARPEARTGRPLEEDLPRPHAQRLRGPGPRRPRGGPRRRTGAAGRAADAGAGGGKKSLGLAPLRPEQRREVVMALATDYPVRLVCRATGWPRSTFSLRAAPADEAGLRAALSRLA